MEFSEQQTERIWDVKQMLEEWGGEDCLLTNGVICMTASGKLNTEPELLLLLAECELMGLSGTKHSANRSKQLPKKAKTIETKSLISRPIEEVNEI